jgi:hypothetical protein
MQTMEMGRSEFVMAGLVPAIHVFPLEWSKDVDARHKAGHDEFRQKAFIPLAAFESGSQNLPEIHLK